MRPLLWRNLRGSLRRCMTWRLGSAPPHVRVGRRIVVTGVWIGIVPLRGLLRTILRPLPLGIALLGIRRPGGRRIVTRMGGLLPRYRLLRGSSRLSPTGTGLPGF